MTRSEYDAYESLPVCFKHRKYLVTCVHLYSPIFPHVVRKERNYYFVKGSNTFLVGQLEAVSHFLY